jgi:carboxymethylenebutenolidase
MVRMTTSFFSGPIRLPGHGGDEIEAYLAQPADGPSRGAVVVIHHLPGYDRWSLETTRRFAEMGYDAICPNLFWREAPGAEPDDAAATARAQGGPPDEQLGGDVAGAMTYLRALPNANGKVASIGFCSGGRQSVLAACELDLTAAIDCYGAYVVGDPPSAHPIKSNLLPYLDKLHIPLLGLFGADDKAPNPDHVAELDRILNASNCPHEFHTFEGAGHAFFSTDRVSYRVEAATTGWDLISDFLARQLS